MLFGDLVRRVIKYYLAIGLMVCVVSAVTLLAVSTMMLTNPFYNHFCVEEPGSKTTEKNDASVMTAFQGDQELDTWDASGANDYLMKYNTKLNNNSQPITADPNNISTITEWWQAAAMFSWYLHSSPRYTCEHLVNYGNWAVCQDKKYMVRKPCLVYSFGIAYDFRFDDEMGNIGCDVRSFDPSMNRSDHKRSDNVSFYALGLSGKNTNDYQPGRDSYVRSPQTWKLRTLKTIRRGLGHTHRILDVLKIDIEIFEWEVIDNIIEADLLKYIRHLLVEYHLFADNLPPMVNYVHYFQVHTLLRQLGFREYRSSPHSILLVPGKFRHQGEVYYVNARFNASILPDVQVTDNQFS